MQIHHDAFPGADGLSLPYTLRLPDTPPRAVLAILHGMTEHRGRYIALAEHLTANGIACAAFDLRGHGEHPTDAKCASLGVGGWEKSLSDVSRFAALLRERFPETPLFYLGFSLGSFLLREHLAISETPYAGAVIIGTGHQPPAVLSVISAIVASQVKKYGYDASTPLVQKLSFDTYNTKFRPNRTASDWLCADEAMLDAYIADPLCRPHISAGLFYDLLCAMKRTGARQYPHLRRPEMPILLLSGDQDPVGDFGRGVRHVASAIKKAGAANITCSLYPGARHDLLHEEASGNAALARSTITDWIISQLS